MHVMTGHDVLRVLDALHVNGVSPIIEGGWGVDALLGRQTRAHVDVDLIVTEAERDDTLDTLDGLGYDQVLSTAAGRLSIGQRDGRTIDLHIIDTGFVQQTSEGPFRYPDGMLQGRGLIVGRPVRCLTAEGQILTHADHDLSDFGRADLFLLADQVGARLYYPLARGIDMVCRDAEEADISAMAAVMANAVNTRPISQVPATKSLASDTYWHYWQQRLQLPRTTALVISVGEAIAATVAISPWRGADFSAETAAVLFGLAKHCATAVDHLDDLLLERARVVARQQDFTDLLTWVTEDDRITRSLFERSGWTPDGGRHEIAPGLTRIRYASR